MRTDIHSKGKIIPANYHPVLFYALPTTQEGFAMPAWNVQAVIALRTSGAKFAEHGGLGTCTVCGARFLTGEVWKHIDTEEHIHVGHVCAEKYDLLHDWSDDERKLKTTRAALVLQMEKEARREHAYTAHPGLREALQGTHRIIGDIRGRFEANGYISPAQVSLVFKLATEAHKKAEAPTEAHMPAPEGRVTFTGTIVSKKFHDNDYGGALKITVKVSHNGAVWLAWMTCPSSLASVWSKRTCPRTGDQLRGPQVGEVHTFTATLARGKDAHFAFGKRPIHIGAARESALAGA